MNKQYRVYQMISIFVEAENEMEAIEKVKQDENKYDGWTKWEIECVDGIPTDDDIANDIIDFYPPLNTEGK